MCATCGQTPSECIVCSSLAVRWVSASRCPQEGDSRPSTSDTQGADRPEDASQHPATQDVPPSSSSSSSSSSVTSSSTATDSNPQASTPATAPANGAEQSDAGGRRVRVRAALAPGETPEVYALPSAYVLTMEELVQNKYPVQRHVPSSTARVPVHFVLLRGQAGTGRAVGHAQCRSSGWPASFTVV